jgi:acetoin utilization deacetylase AcuC-like enzyme
MKMNFGVLYDSLFLDHYCASYDHPERPERLGAVIQGLKSAGAWENATHVPPRPVTMEELLGAHTESYVTNVQEILKKGGSGNLDADTFFSPGSLKAALNAAGGGIDLALKVQSREVDCGFAAVRPPGHHATWNRPMGFCIFNNIALAAKNLVKSGSAERIAIVDWDVHHGNGTQDQFWDDPSVMYFSIHQWPFYPGTGRIEDLGAAEAIGKTVNLPMPAQAVDGDYLLAMDEIFLPLIEAFSPNHIMISAGFDAHSRDPLAGMLLSTDCFAQMAARLKAAADRICGSRLTIFLEGGYDLSALEEAARATIQGVKGETTPSKPEPLNPERRQHQVIKKAISVLKEYWSNEF